MGTELIFKRPVQGVCKNYAIPGASLRRVRKLEDVAAERTLAFVVMPRQHFIVRGHDKDFENFAILGHLYKDLTRR